MLKRNAYDLILQHFYSNPSDVIVLESQVKESQSEASCKPNEVSTSKSTEVPLKHRLRSTSRQQVARNDEEEHAARDMDKEQDSLADENAAAIQSIINANMNKEKVANFTGETTKRLTSGESNNLQDLAPTVTLPPTDDKETNGQQGKSSSTVCAQSTVLTEGHQPAPVATLPTQDTSTFTKPECAAAKSTRKTSKNESNSRRKPTEKSRAVRKSSEVEEPTELVSTTTLILCSQEEFSTYLSSNMPLPVTNSPLSKISPKGTIFQGEKSFYFFIIN